MQIVSHCWQVFWIDHCVRAESGARLETQAAGAEFRFRPGAVTTAMTLRRVFLLTDHIFNVSNEIRLEQIV